MVFNIKNKVCLVTGGASGIGLALTIELLKKEAKGVTIADVNEPLGKTVTATINENFGPNKVIFVKTDVSNRESFKNAFEETLKHFDNIDILCNNAGIYEKEKEWEKLFNVNLKGIIYGATLAQEEYLSKYKQDDEAVIINTSSIGGISIFPASPMYSCAKFGVSGLTISLGAQDHYDKYKVKIIAVCPGYTDTPLSRYAKANAELSKRFNLNAHNFQSAEYLAQEAIRIIEKANTGTLWVVQDSQPAFQYILPEIKSMENNRL